jgi:hypothetical protein
LVAVDRGFPVRENIHCWCSVDQAAQLTDGVRVAEGAANLAPLVEELAGHALDLSTRRQPDAVSAPSSGVWAAKRVRATSTFSGRRRFHRESSFEEIIAPLRIQRIAGTPQTRCRSPWTQESSIRRLGLDAPAFAYRGHWGDGWSLLTGRMYLRAPSLPAWPGASAANAARVGA